MKRRVALSGSLYIYEKPCITQGFLLHLSSHTTNVMTLKEKLAELSTEIQSYKYAPNVDAYYPLPQKIMQLQKLIDIGHMGEYHFKERMRIYSDSLLATTLKSLSIKRCWQDRDCREQAIKRAKENVALAVKNFITICNDSGHPEYLEQITQV